MPFLGSQPADQYQSLAKQTITGDGSTAYTLNRSVTNAYDMEVFINNVRQEPDTSYTASGNTITFTAAVTASDSCYLIYQGQSVGSINPPANSVGGNEIQNTSVTHNHLHTNMDLSSKTVRIDAMNMGTGTDQWQLATQSAVSNRFALRSTHTTLGDGNPFIIYQPTSAGAQNDALVITADGYITKNKQPAFRVGKTSAQQDSGGSHINPITYQVSDYNIGNHFSLSTDKFTAPIAGRYLFGWGVGAYRHSASWMGVYSYKNNAFLDYSQTFAYSTGSWHNFDGSILVNLAVNDTFHIVLRNDSNASVDNSGCFWGYLVG